MSIPKADFQAAVDWCTNQPAGVVHHVIDAALICYDLTDNDLKDIFKGELAYFHNPAMQFPAALYGTLRSEFCNAQAIVTLALEDQVVLTVRCIGGPLHGQADRSIDLINTSAPNSPGLPMFIDAKTLLGDCQFYLQTGIFVSSSSPVGNVTAKLQGAQRMRAGAA